MLINVLIIAIVGVSTIITLILYKTRDRKFNQKHRKNTIKDRRYDK